MNQLLKDIFLGREISTFGDKVSKKVGHNPRPLINGLGQHLVASDFLTLEHWESSLCLRERSLKNIKGKSEYLNSPYHKIER